MSRYLCGTNERWTLLSVVVVVVSHLRCGWWLGLTVPNSFCAWTKCASETARWSRGSWIGNLSSRSRWSKPTRPTSKWFGYGRSRELRFIPFTGLSSAITRKITEFNDKCDNSRRRFGQNLGFKVAQLSKIVEKNLQIWIWIMNLKMNYLQSS